MIVLLKNMGIIFLKTQMKVVAFADLKMGVGAE